MNNKMTDQQMERCQKIAEQSGTREGRELAAALALALKRRREAK